MSQLPLKEAFIQVIKDYPINSTASAWKCKLSKGTLKEKTMRKVLKEFGAVKVQDEIWEINNNDH